MKQIPAILLLFSTIGFSQTVQTFHDYKGKTITGGTLDFSAFYGKKVMVVNTATYCAWTYQYQTLEDLYEQFKDSNFVIIGFPCNDFSNQEPGTDSTINDFCTGTYGITFQMMSKVAVVSHDTAEVYKWLQRKDLNGVTDAHVVWNFNKFLIDEAGHWVAHYTNLTEPNDPAIISWIRSPSVLPDTTDTTTTGINEVGNINMNTYVNQPGNITVSFNNMGNQPVMVGLFSISGQLLSKIHDGMLREGEGINIDTRSFSNGIYFLQVRTDHANKMFRLPVVN